MTPDSQFDPYQSGQPAACPTLWSPPETIQELAAEETDLVAELIQSFTADVEDRLHLIRSALNSANTVVLRYQIHAIKGSSKQMAADRVASICEQIEAAGRERPISQLADLVTQLEVRVGEVCAAMAWYQRTDNRRAC
jgi:HPt (histidine-containing phosphotransfer) domain-containing protein